MQLAKRKLGRFPAVPAHFHRPVDLGCGCMHGSISSLLEMTEYGAYLLAWNKMFAAGGFFYIIAISITRCKSSSVPLQFGLILKFSVPFRKIMV